MKYKLIFLFTLVNNFISFGQDSIVGTIQITFQEFELEIDGISVWDEEEKLKLIQKDTAVVYLELGETIEGLKIKISTKKELVFKVFQRFENSVTVMNEGPHCDLIDWKHYNSKWKALRITNGAFITESYRETDWEKFIEVNMNELREAVRKQCGDSWAEHIKDVKSPNEYPCGVSTSRIFLKIESVDLLENIRSEHIISFEIPMGC